MISHWPKPQRRLLALAVLMVVIVLLFILLINPLLSRYLQYGESIDSMQNQLAVYQRLSEGREQLEIQLQQLQAMDTDQEFYLPESKPALAAARLQQYLSDIIKISGGQVISTQILSRQPQEQLEGIAIQVHMQLEIGELVTLLHGIESGRPLLFVDDLVITTNTRPTRQRQRQVNQNRHRSASVVEARSLDVRFELVGYASKESVI